jgi:hypothetical protein
LADLEERGAGVEQAFNAVAGEQFAARGVAVAGFLGAAPRRGRNVGAEAFREGAIVGGASLRFGRGRIEFGVEAGAAHREETSAIDRR